MRTFWRVGADGSPALVRSLAVRVEVRRSESGIGAVVLGSNSELLRDSVAVLPCSMMYKDLLMGALVKLGFTAADCIGAKGATLVLSRCQGCDTSPL